MSIAILAKKSRAQRGASTLTGWTLATTKSGKCPGPCGGGAPAKQKSFRLLMKNKQQGGGPNPGGMQSKECCKTTYKEIIKPDGEQSASGYTWKKKQLTHDCVRVCDVSGVVCPLHSCNNTGCKCNCNKSLGGTSCCNVHKDMPPLSISENIPWVVKMRTCHEHWNIKPPPQNNTC